MLKYRYILCLDVSLASTGLVILDLQDRQPVVAFMTTIRTSPPEHIANRQAEILLTIVRIVNEYGLNSTNTVVALEDYGSSKIRGKLYERVELTGMIKFCLSVNHAMLIYKIMPVAMKSFMGAGKKKKNEIKQAALTNFGFSGGNEHIRDAYCLGRYLLAYLLGMSLNVAVHYPMSFVKNSLQPSANKPGRLRLIPLTAARRGLTLPLRIAKPRS